MKYDVFICHASEDKDDFVSPLAQHLNNAGLRVWYDKFILKLGDSLSEKIDFGLSNSQKGIVVLSPYFFKKKWTKRELRGLIAREVNGESIILPIWHNITYNEICKHSPPLADLLAANSDDGIEIVSEQIISLFIDNDTNQKGFVEDVKKRSHKYLSFNQSNKYNIGIISNGRKRKFNLLNKLEGRQFLGIGILSLRKEIKDKKISIVMADIDELTQINKNYGIEVGDRVLKKTFDIFREITKDITPYTGSVEMILFFQF